MLCYLFHGAEFLSAFSDDSATPKKRSIQTCHLEDCGHRKVSSACFARHLAKLHKLSKSEKQRIQFLHKTRKPYTWKVARPAAKYKDYHVQRKCPVIQTTLHRKFGLPKGLNVMSVHEQQVVIYLVPIQSAVL